MAAMWIGKQLRRAKARIWLSQKLPIPRMGLNFSSRLRPWRVKKLQHGCDHRLPTGGNMSSASQPVNKGLGRVSEREQLLLSLIVTYGFIVKSTWMRLSNGNKDSEDAMASAMWTLTRKRMVIARTLHHGISYFMLTEATATTLGLPKFRSQPMSEASKLRMRSEERV